MNKKDKIWVIISIILAIFCVVSLSYIFKYKEENYPVIEYENDSSIKDIASPMLDAYIKQHKNIIKNQNNENIKIGYYSYKNSQLIAGDEKNVAVSVIFELQPYNKNDKNKLNHLGLIDDEGLVHCDWTFIIRKIEDNKYKLLDVLKTSEAKKKLNIDSENVNILKPSVTVEKCNYKIEKNTLFITYDEGDNWIKTPVEVDSLIYDETEKEKLSKGSYYISKDRIAFIDGLGQISISQDKAKTWKTLKLKLNIDRIRKSFIGFTEKGFGYAIVSGDQAMSFEMIDIYTSEDSGDTWTYKGPLKEDGSSFITGASFSTDKIGFITTKTNSIYTTNDEGCNWKKIEMPMPEELKHLYDNPNAPIFKGKHGELYIDQGEDSDYGSGESQMCKFISEDYGVTWEFNGEVVK